METITSVPEWERFVKDSRPNLSMNRIARLSPEELRQQREKYSQLIEIASPIVQKIIDSFMEKKMMALLISEEGYVLVTIGGTQVLFQEEKIHSIEGLYWYGIKGSLPIIGLEGFCCGSAPIYREDKKTFGNLQLLCPFEKSKPYLEGIAKAVAYGIEQEFIKSLYIKDMELIGQTMELVNTNKIVVVINSDDMIVHASPPFRQCTHHWFRMRMEDMRKHGFKTKKKIPLYSKSGNIAGYCIELLEEKQSVQRKSLVARSKPFVFKGEEGTSKAFQLTLSEVRRVAKTNACVHLYGETGTGKELIARAIHENSSRKNGPFIAVNCGAIPKSLMESELFGFAGGAFTGAIKGGYKGKLEQANNGTLFLDEIGEIPKSMQVALLRAIQEQVITPIGSTKEIPLNIRIITATHQNLSDLVEQGIFREDLYYRLYVYPIRVPPLRERIEDIPHLVRHFCKNKNWQMVWPPEFFEQLQSYHWPGNIRELMNVLERLMIVTQDEDPIDIMEFLSKLMIPSERGNEQRFEGDEELTAREKVQKRQMIEALHKTNGHVSLAAKHLNVPRSTFYKRMKKFHL